MRKLASIRVVEDVFPIPDADKIEAILIDGWSVVTQKGNFKKGDKCVYFEIDSVFKTDSVVGQSLPLEKASSYNTEEEGKVEGFRIKTIKLRGQISQGYALPLSYFSSFKNVNLEAEDLTFELGVLKYEAPFVAFGSVGSAQTESSFPTNYIKKTDQERAQNLKHVIFDHYLNDTVFEVTYKLDGSSMTVGRYVQHEQTVDTICSRNNALRLTFENDTSQFLLQGKPVLNKLKENYLEGIAFQGELIGPAIQKNFEGVDNYGYYIYNCWLVKDAKYLPPKDAREMCQTLGVNYVPVKHEAITLKELFGENLETPQELLTKLLEYAEGPSAFNGKYREGFVYKTEDGSFSFKTISNQYLLKEK